MLSEVYSFCLDTHAKTFKLYRLLLELYNYIHIHCKLCITYEHNNWGQITHK